MNIEQQYSVRLYQTSDFQLWNEFIENAKNSTFLFHRNFIEYHSDRFDDYSLLIFKKEKLVSLLPANKVGNILYSHQGLTYGGFVFKNHSDYFEINLIISEVLSYLQANDFKTLIIKEIVSIYFHESDFKKISELYIKNGARVILNRMNLAINFKSDFKISKSKIKHFNKIKSRGLEIRKEDDLTSFWNTVLIPRLLQKFNSKPVHSLDEISNLKMNFPDNILQYNVYFEDEILAGITIFKTKHTIKSQYGATTENGQSHRALDYLYINLINEYKIQYDYFDMGTVDDNSELGYNLGLFNQKKELGCDIFEQKSLEFNI